MHTKLNLKYADKLNMTMNIENMTMNKQACINRDKCDAQMDG